ncbi:hypothetical protein CATMIT_01981, partial [Catenibacterium mitsuokai DSM 15897]
MGVGVAQIGVGHALEPEQPLAVFGMRGDALRQRVHVPALLADDDQVAAVAQRPQALERAQRHVVALARLQRADHQHRLAVLAHRGAHCRARRLVGDAAPFLDVVAQMRVADAQARAVRRLGLADPHPQVVGDRARNADQPVAVGDHIAQPALEHARHELHAILREAQ